MKITTMFRDMPPSTGLQQAAERWVTRLEQVCDQIEGCQVTVERLHRHHLYASSFEVHIAVALADTNLVVTQTSKDAYVALADAFRAARRTLLDHPAEARVAKPTGAGHFAGFVASKSS
ncbi:MAG TPA: HPF/RaiA family ribosome-associated protein [Kofleriaceae bacterium]|jgi:ribosome-associated translation inhibitor RaiA